MEITLRNGENITLDWNPIILDYLEEYNGGIAKLKEDIEKVNCRFLAFNHILYSVVNASYPEELTYRQAVSLVNINDIDKIVDFIVKNVAEVKTDNVEEKNENNVANEMRYHRR